MASWASILRHEQEELNRIRQVQAAPLPDVDEGPVVGVIWEKFHVEELFFPHTNFTEHEVRTIVQNLQPYIAAARRRGPEPKSSWADAVLCYLVLMKHGFDFATGATVCALKPGRYADNVHRARGVLLECLRERWWRTRERPTPLVQTRFPHAGLLVDTQTVECFRPKARFEEAKAYWDGKNKIYGLKKEVAVRAAAPHYCMFSQRARVASVHDYSINKETYETYLEYLRKTDDERNALPADRESRFWAAVLDKAYVGPASDTPHFRRITPIKNPTTVADSQHNAAVNPIRVPVEQYFGRMWKAWGALRHPYRFDHAHFDDDYDLLCLLTNELIAATPLNDDDHSFYTQLLHLRRQKSEAREAKRRAAEAMYRTNKRARLVAGLEHA